MEDVLDLQARRSSQAAGLVFDELSTLNRLLHWVKKLLARQKHCLARGEVNQERRTPRLVTANML